jgi:hypothetical protein
MRKSLLAMAALMGVATLPAHAWRVNIDRETFADIGFSTIVRGIYQGARTDAQRSSLNFFVPLFNITASGQVNNLVYFSMNAEGGSTTANLAANTIRVRDSFIGLKFADEFRVQAGVMRAPFSRAALTGVYVQLFPYRPGFTITNPTDVEVDPPAGGTSLNPRDHGIVVWGNVADGLVKYYLGITDGATIADLNDDSLAFTIRVQFTPVMAGFKAETGYALWDTYLGRQNVLSIGVGYRSVGRSSPAVTTNMLTVDLLYEQKFGDAVPNFQAGYINKQNANNINGRRATQFYAQAGILFDQMVGFGKPAGAIRFEINSDEGGTVGQARRENRFGVWGHYYIKGQAAKVSLGFDSITFERVTGRRNFTDVTLQFQSQF